MYSLGFARVSNTESRNVDTRMITLLLRFAMLFIRRTHIDFEYTYWFLVHDLSSAITSPAAYSKSNKLLNATEDRQGITTVAAGTFSSLDDVRVCVHSLLYSIRLPHSILPSMTTHLIMRSVTGWVSRCKDREKSTPKKKSRNKQTNKRNEKS